MFIVIEKGPSGELGWASIVTYKNGNNKTFDTIEEAQKEANKCQDGIIVGDETVSVNTFKLMKELKTFLNAMNVEVEEDSTINLTVDNPEVLKTYSKIKEEVLKW